MWKNGTKVDCAIEGIKNGEIFFSPPFAYIANTQMRGIRSENTLKGYKYFFLIPGNTTIDGSKLGKESTAFLDRWCKSKKTQNGNIQNNGKVFNFKYI